ncbi:MAG TPA: hypothetical protein VLF19_10035, partial [Methylomirabilota bacterium]|nr:hypothetical protein [Methylomirabilota bacterium]
MNVWHRRCTDLRERAGSVPAHEGGAGLGAPGPSREELLARAAQPGEEALRLHALCGGKMQTLPKC